LVALGHSVPKVNEEPGQVAVEVAELGAEGVVAILPSPEKGRAGELLSALRAWRRVERRVPLLLVAGGGWDWRLQADGSGLHPFAVMDEPESASHAAWQDALQEWMPTEGGTDPAVREALQALGEGVIVVDLAGNVSFMNRAAEGFTGWAAEEAVGRALGEIFVTDGTGLPPEGTAGLRRRDGIEVRVEGELAPLTGDDGGLLGSVLVFQAAAAYAPGVPGELATAIADPVFVLDAAGRITFVNEAEGNYFELPPEQVLGREFWSGLPAEVSERFAPVFAEVQESKRPATCEFELPADGVWLELQVHALGDGLLVMVRDVTGAKNAQHELRRSERLEALGHLARGFSHGFNNLLTVILGNMALAEAASRDEVQKGMLREASFAARKAQGLVHQIMIFARGGAPVKGLVPVAPLLRQIVQERQAEHPHFVYRLSVEVLEIVVRADPKQLRRLLENLLLNAEQASQSGATISIVCRAETVADESSWLVIEVLDAGAGMTEEVMRQAFEPFFSTRQPLNATGLGLTVCESIARAHGGTVTLHSTPGRGTTVTVRLPLAHPVVSPSATGSGIEPFRNGIRTGHASHSGARILVLEDESLIRRLIHSTLTQAGHRVDEAREGQSAINAYRDAAQSGDPYDLLIMDLTIENGMGGVEAMHRIKEIDPAACAIVSSGYSDDPAMADPQLYGFSSVLPKPYQPVELVDAVEAMLRNKH
jgi:PAS domain S-box-containing protein